MKRLATIAVLALLILLPLTAAAQIYDDPAGLRGVGPVRVQIEGYGQIGETLQEQGYFTRLRAEALAVLKELKIATDDTAEVVLWVGVVLLPAGPPGLILVSIDSLIIVPHQTRTAAVWASGRIGLMNVTQGDPIRRAVMAAIGHFAAQYVQANGGQHI